MTYEEMSNFTYAELSNLTWGDLELSPTELLQKVLNEYGADEIPSSVIYKLHHICKSLSQACVENNIEIPTQIESLKSKTRLSKADMISLIADILGIIGFLTSLIPQSEPVVQEIHIHNNYTINYITNEYDNDINYIIQELEQTQNVTVNVSENLKDALSE